MTRKIYGALAILLTLLALAQPSSAERRSGMLQGKITDNQGFPMNGAYIYVTSPSLIGIRTFITSASGTYAFPGLPPGRYKIIVEMPGFKTVNVEGVALDAGATLARDFKLEPTEIEDESVTRPAGPGLDRSSARLATVIDRDLIARLPLPRDFSAVLGLVPGVVIAGEIPGLSAAVHGAPVTENAFMEDGVNVTDVIGGTAMSRINVDVIDDVVVETAGLPIDRHPGQGAYVNVIRRSGANDFDGSLALYFTGRDFSKSLWPADGTAATSAAAPRVDTGLMDLSFTAGGPLIHDLGWFFSNLRFRTRSQDTPFQTWKDPLRFIHDPYGWRDTSLSGTFKLSTKVTRQFSGMTEVSFSKATEPVYEADLGWNRPRESTRRLDGEAFFLARANLVYTLDQRTLFDFSLGYTTLGRPLLLNGEGAAKPSYFDSGTGYVWGSGAYNDQEKRKRFRVNLTMTRAQDRVLGAAHELVAGAEYETGKGSSTAWKADDLVMDYFNGSPYTFGQAVSPVSGATVGVGWIGFSLLPAGSSTAPAVTITRELKHIGAFAQDTLTIGGRVALSLGLRFDRSDTQIFPITKYSVGNEVAVSVGTNLIKPVYGFNPFGGTVFGQWENVLTWNSLSPRFGLSVDLLGTGRTFLRGSFSRLPEELNLGYIRNLDPLSLDRVHGFRWYDEDGDGKVEKTDTFVAYSYNYNIYKTDTYTQRVAPGLRAPMVTEWTAGLDHELMRDFSLSLRYINRSETGILGDVMYDPSAEVPWYTLEGSPAGWWVPFTTTVPASTAYPATDVTVYFRSTAAPASFDRIQEVPELSRKYRGLEFSFRKRMSHNWQLVGSVVWSKSTGTAGLLSPLAAGLASPVLTPNSFINVPSTSRTDLDRPLAIRVMGTLRFKYDIFLSAYYRFMSGSAWGRTVTIVPPADWAQEHGAEATPVTVFLEAPGTRRHGGLQSTDLRLEKDFVRSGRTRWTLYLDVLNVFGDKYRIIDYNDGSWYPDGEGASAGTHVLSGTYGQAVFLSGTRTFAFSVALGF